MVRALLAAALAAAGLSAFSQQAMSGPAPSADERARAFDVYKTIVEMDTSVEGNKVPEMAAYLAGVFKDGGFPADDIHIVPHEKTASLVVRFRGDGTGGKPILLMGHMDVVTAHREDWTRDPFKLVEEKGFFFGRGTADDKSGVASLTATFVTLKKEGFVPTRDLIIAFTGDEETVGLTATSLVQEHRELVDAEFAINSDSGGGEISEEGKPQTYALQTAEKTFASFKLTAHNEGGHSSQPRRDNAIYDIMRAAQALQHYAFPVMWNATTIASFKANARVTDGPAGDAMRSFVRHPGNGKAAAFLSESPFYVGQLRTTCIPTMMQAGHADNALPQSAHLIVNCRIFPGVKIATVQAQLQKLTGPKIEIATLEKNYTSSDASPLRQDVVDAVTTAVHASYPGVPIVPSMSAGASDGVFYRAAGIPTYGASEIFIKNSDDLSHGLNERLPVNSFYAGLTHWRVLLTKIAGKH